jgi:Peptidase C39 family
VAAAVLLMAAAFPCTATAAATEDAVRLLEVPYLPQTEQLCGGAAAAMVMRYWGARDVHADTFAHLVSPALGGIRGEDLLRALTARSWQATSFRGDKDLVAKHLSLGRPIIALIEDRPGAFHYVVLVAWTANRVIAHDPARAPFRIHDEAAFLAAWEKSGYWAMLLLAGEHSRDAGAAAAGASVPSTSVDRDACAPITVEGVRLAGAGQVDAARRLLEVATEACPSASGPRRELAGVHAIRGEWSLAATRAREALDRDAADTHAARILGTSLFLSENADDALEAWNVAGEPRIDLVTVHGLERVRHDPVAKLLQLENRAMLTPDALRRARRRLAELPAASATRVAYVPRERGRADVEATIVERSLFPTGLVPLGAIAAEAAIDREVRVAIGSVTGGGEAFGVGWRWWEQRPAAAVTMSMPSPIDRVGAVWTVSAEYDQQTYGATEVEERRRSATFSAVDWIGDRWRWQAGAGVARWSGRDLAVALNGSLARHAADDRWRIQSALRIYAGGVDTASASLFSEWRSKRALRQGSGQAPERTVWHARGGLEVTGDSAPLGLWPGAGTGHARTPLLRAHALLDDGVIRDGVFGRTLAHGGIEWRRWMQPGLRLWRIAPAVFVDVARAWRTADGFDRRAHADIGAGVRVNVPGGGAFRVDVARGLRDGEMAVSAGWSR